MALKVELKPGERIILGECVVTNDDQRTRLLIEGDVPILREKDILTPATADTPAKRIYLAVQLMYLARDPLKLRNEYLSLIKEFLQAAPSATPLVEQINKEILTGALYKGLKAARGLVAYEKRLIENASGDERLRADSAENGEPT